MWKAIKWGFGIMLGILLAYIAFWAIVVGGLAALVVSSQ